MKALRRLLRFLGGARDMQIRIQPTPGGFNVHRRLGKGKWEFVGDVPRWANLTLTDMASLRTGDAS